MPVAEQGHILYWIYPFHPISSNFRFSQQKSPLPPQLNREKFQTGSIHFRKFPATLGSASSKASIFPRSQTGKIFRLDLFISGNFWQLWFQLAENPMSCIGICLDWIYTFQAIFMNFGLSWQKNPQPRNQMESFLEWIHPFQAIFSNFGLSWQLSSLSGAKQAFFQTEFIHFRQFLNNFGFSWQLSPPQGPNRQSVQTGFIHFRQFPATLAFSWQKNPQPRNQMESFLDWIYPFQAIFSNFGLSWQKAPSQGPNRHFLD